MKDESSTRRTSRFLALLLVPALAACQSTERGEGTPSESAGGSESVSGIASPDALEALFRHQFDHNASGGQRNVSAFCLRYQEQDPPATFLVRFADVTPVVRPFSACQFRDVRWEEAASRMPALVHYVSELSCSGDTCEARGGYMEANLSASGNRYRLERVGGQWQVTSDNMEWIS